ncbi:MAG: hypothetical protein V8K32_07660 [Candidatus Electrothrix gigas]
MKALFVFISIIFFSPFLLLNTPAFGQDTSQLKKCLKWEKECLKWEQGKRERCRKVVSPVRPDKTEECETYYVAVCVISREDCMKWVSPDVLDLGTINLRQHTVTGNYWYSENEHKAHLADILTLTLGATLANPILPSDITINRNGRVTFHIQINITIEIVGRIQWVDPVIAVGYDYFIDHGPSVKDIKLPEGIGDNRYNLWVFDPELNDFKDSGVELVGGEKYKFETPIRKFSIRGIEVDAGLDPKNQRAFPTGLSFDRTGKVSMRMVPITVDTDKQ